MEELLDVGLVHVGLGDGHHVGADVRGDLLLVDRRECLVDALPADGAGVLGDQDVEGAVGERGDLVGFRVEGGDLDLALLARGLQSGGDACRVLAAGADLGGAERCAEAAEADDRRGDPGLRAVR